jgi:hypothetical protein
MYVPRGVLLALLLVGALASGWVMHVVADQVGRQGAVVEVPVSTPVQDAPDTTTPVSGTTNIYLTIVNGGAGASPTTDQVIIPAP